MTSVLSGQNLKLSSGSLMFSMKRFAFRSCHHLFIFWSCKEKYQILTKYVILLLSGTEHCVVVMKVIL